MFGFYIIEGNRNAGIRAHVDVNHLHSRLEILPLKRTLIIEIRYPKYSTHLHEDFFDRSLSPTNISGAKQHVGIREVP